MSADPLLLALDSKSADAGFADVLAALLCADPAAKIAAIRSMARRWPHQPARSDDLPVVAVIVPGRPERPLLVAPRELKSRGLGTVRGRVALIHAVAHIEFNAINLALDAMYRFRAMPPGYYRDWLGVALDESRHFEMLCARLAELGHGYGDLPAHNGLWEAACSTADSCLRRMALVPRVLEARGLDVTPSMIERLQQAGDQATVAVLQIILSEEVAHVEIGTRWFRHCCAEQRLDADRTFIDLVRAHANGGIRRPFNESARREAGFSDDEQAGLGEIADGQLSVHPSKSEAAALLLARQRERPPLRR